MNRLTPVFTAMCVLLCLNPLYAIHEDSLVIEDDFENVFYNVSANTGKNVVWGGIIDNIQQSPDGMKLTIREIPLNYLGKSNGAQYSGGRFVAQGRQGISTEVFGLGKLCIIIGTVTGSVTMPLGQEQYTYPVISIKTIHPCDKSTISGYLRKQDNAGLVKIQGPFCNDPESNVNYSTHK